MPTKTKPKYDHIAPALWDLVQPMDQFITHPRNARQGDIGAIIGSLQRFGQQKPIVAQKRTDGPHIIIAGNHLFRAADELGWGAIAVVVAEMDDTTAMSYMIADNRTQELGTYDDQALADLLSSLAMSGNLEGTGYDGDDVDSLLNSLMANVPDPNAPSDPSLQSEVIIEIRCPRSFVEEIGATLALWRERDGVEISIA